MSELENRIDRYNKRKKFLGYCPSRVGGGGRAPLCGLRGSAARQGMVFGLSVMNRVYNV